MYEKMNRWNMLSTVMIWIGVGVMAAGLIVFMIPVYGVSGTYNATLHHTIPITCLLAGLVMSVVGVIIKQIISDIALEIISIRNELTRLKEALHSRNTSS